MELRDALHAIGESHEAASWPYDLEDAIEDWLDGGDRDAIPFEDRRFVATPAFYARLRELRQRIEGWLYYEHERGIVWARGEEQRQLRAARAVHGRGRPHRAGYRERLVQREVLEASAKR